MTEDPLLSQNRSPSGGIRHLLLIWWRRLRQRLSTGDSYAVRFHWSSWGREAVGVFSYFCLVTLLITWPLVLRMRDSFLCQRGDNSSSSCEIACV